MNDECLICGAPLEYLSSDEDMSCAVCGRSLASKTRCISGHFVCDRCHIQGLDGMLGICLNEKSRNPAHILNRLMSLPSCHMHGPEHHVLVGAALMTAFHNAGGEIDLRAALAEMSKRGGAVPGGACGFWGACGAGISTGMFVSIATGATPLAKASFGLANGMTARALQAIGGIGGPRCCKRDSYLALEQAVRYVAENLGVAMEWGPVTCAFSSLNNQCLGVRCPFSKAHRIQEGR